MLNRFFRRFAKRVAFPLARALVAAGVSANALTISGFLIVVAACWLIANGRLFAGGLVLVLGALFDVLDGTVAKLGNMTSKAGAFLDSTVDRLSDALLFFAIFWQYLGRGVVWSAGTAGRDLPQNTSLTFMFSSEVRAGALLALAALVLGLFVSYIKARAEGLGMDCSVGLAERPERVALPAFGLLFGPLLPALGVLVALSAFTAIQRFVYVWRQAGSPEAGAE